MPLFALQGLGITFPAVMDLPVHNLWPCPPSLIMFICQLAAGAQWVVFSPVRQRGPVLSKPMVTVSLLQGLVDWSGPGLRERGQILLEFLFHTQWKWIIKCQEQNYSSALLGISVIFSVGWEEGALSVFDTDSLCHRILCIMGVLVQSGSIYEDWEALVSTSSIGQMATGLVFLPSTDKGGSWKERSNFGQKRRNLPDNYDLRGRAHALVLI